jgi:predicted methyltransferase
MSSRRREWRQALGALVMGMAMAALVTASQDGSTRDAWQKVDEVFAALDVKEGSRVADVGAGDGFFTVRLARHVGERGRVYPADVSERALERLGANIERERLTNVEPIHSVEDDPRLPSGLDAILVVNAYHEFEHPDAMLRHFHAALREGGRLVILEPITARRRGQSREDQTADHEIDAHYVEAEVRAAGFRVARLEDPFTTRPSRRPVEEWLLVAVK